MPQSEFWPFTENNFSKAGFKADANVMQKQLGDMEGQVREIQMELAAIKRNRTDIVAQKKIETLKNEREDDNGCCTVTMKEIHENNPEENSEVAVLRKELLKVRSAADEERKQREKYEKKLKDLENQLCNIYHTGMSTEEKDSRKIPMEEFIVIKKQLRDVKEELEESNFIVNDTTEQLQDYRSKYLQAQQQVEELKRQLNVVESDNKQVSDQLHMEIQKMKLQFQEKLLELAPLPDLLKGAQLQLEEAKQLQKLAEDTSRQLSDELHHVKEKLVIAVNNYNQEKYERENLLEENKIYKTELDKKEKDIDEMSKKIDEYKCQVLRFEEKLAQQEILYKEKSVEYTRLFEDMNEARVENNRCLKRHKERTENMRKYFLSHIADLEQKVSYSRALCKVAEKEKYEIRQRMQSQINNLQQSFDLVELRLRTLHTQVRSIMNTSILLMDDAREIEEEN